MGRRKRRTLPNSSNFMGGSNTEKRDMTTDEFFAMMADVNTPRTRAPRTKRSDTDVMITINPLQNHDYVRLSVRIYRTPEGYEIKHGDVGMFYPMFKNASMGKRLYFVKTENGYSVTRQSENSDILLIQQKCSGEMEYFKGALESGTKRIYADWRIDKNVNLPYLEV